MLCLWLVYVCVCGARYTRAELSALIEIHQEVKQNRRRHHIARQPSHNGTTLTLATANTHKNNGETYIHTPSYLVVQACVCKRNGG